MSWCLFDYAQVELMSGMIDWTNDPIWVALLSPGSNSLSYVDMMQATSTDHLIGWEDLLVNARPLENKRVQYTQGIREGTADDHSFMFNQDDSVITDILLFKVVETFASTKVSGIPIGIANISPPMLTSSGSALNLTYQVILP